MQVPLRLAHAFRFAVRPGLLLSLAVSTIVLTATPFLVPAVADEFDVSLGLAALISSSQLGGFVLASWGAGRWLRPTAGLIRGALSVTAVANLLAVVGPPYQVLLVLRIGSGLGLGVLTWAAWSTAFGDRRRMADVAVVGPIVGAASAPLIGLAITWGGSSLVFAALGLLALVPLPFDMGATGESVARSGSSRPVPAAVVLLGALFIMTMAGSAVFVYSAALGTEQAGLATGAVSMVFALNAVAGIPPARWSGVRRWGGVWLLGVALAAVCVATATVPWLYVLAMAAWGFFFWMGVPAVYQLLAERSRNPADRAGDAQAVMAVGRVVGPVVGGAMISAGSATALGVVAGLMMVAAAAVVVTVEAVVPPRAPTAPSAPAVRSARPEVRPG